MYGVAPVACALVAVHIAVVAAGAALDPTPDPKAVVTQGTARFTVLTDSIIRMQNGQTHDDPTFVALNRRLPVPSFESAVTGGELKITTKNLELRYKLNTGTTFNEYNLQVSVLNVGGDTVIWRPIPTANITLQGNLLGTARTLDGNRGAENMDLNCLTNPRADLHCTLGLVSRDGYVVVDDTGSPKFDNDTAWQWLRQPGIPGPPLDQCNIAGEKRRDCGYIGISRLDCEGKGCCYVGSDDGQPSHANGVPDCFFSTQAQQDLYFFGHGRNYKLALKEFTMISGQVPLPPRFAFGVFYSRYWAYDDIEEMEIVKQYQGHRLPLDVLVTDMDWHITMYNGTHDQAGEQMGWTGFTWDKHLFPNATGFLNWCKARGLKNTLNLHPASGIQPWEERYKEMAEAMGIDPSTNHYVPFVPTDKKFVKNWNEIVLGEREQEGIDFWWLDWQQGEDWIKVPGVNPTFWLNYIFFTNPMHWQRGGVDRRGMLLHRWGGLGNHRYQAGFSGDVVPLWQSLDFQVYFTITASNVAYGFWSHDLGGHITPSPPELYTRWIQWGAFSPIFRTHCTKNADNFRRIWLYPFSYYSIMRRYMAVRASLVPYLYTCAKHAHDSGVSMLRPMYYDFPEADEAYNFSTQYMFGDHLLVSPITAAMNPTYNSTAKAVWLPAGQDFVSWHSGEVFATPCVLKRNYTLSEMPLFAAAGTVVPLRTRDDVDVGSAKNLPSTLKVMVFVAGGAGSIGTGQVYEDDGFSNAYKTGSGAVTTFTYSSDSIAAASTVNLAISAANGTFTGMLTQRAYEVEFRGTWPASAVTVDGMSLTSIMYDTPCNAAAGCFAYDGSHLALHVYSTALAANKPHMVRATLIDKLPSPHLQSNFVGQVRRLIDAKQLLDDQWGHATVHQQNYYSLLSAGETGMRITYDPASIHKELENFPSLLMEARREVTALKLSSDLFSVVFELLQA
eukprot:scpid31380/ scgid21071/ Alpha-xylosidase